LARAKALRRTAERQAEVLRQRHAAVRLAFDAYEQDRRHAGALLAGGLAYRLFLWLLPLSLVLVGAVGLIADLSSFSPEEVARSSGMAGALAATVARAVEDAGKGSFGLLLIGVWLLVWAGKSVVKALRLVSAVAWQIRPTPVAHGFRDSLAFAGITTLLLASPVVLRPLYAGAIAMDVVVWVLSAVAYVPLFAWLLSRLPCPPGITWTSLLPGAALLAVGLQLLRIVTALYFVGKLDRIDDLYGALGVAAVFMVWLFIVGRLLVAAMALNAERQQALSKAHRGQEPPA
jgi:uncharacterized BrkB/YihY/UPF0761 family membrane protein